MNNETWMQQYEMYLRQRFPDRSTARHYNSDLRQFADLYQALVEVTCADIE